MKKSISIIGGGPAAMAVASFLDPLQYEVTIYEKNKSLGRKFLVAGKGGFNLTHSEKGESFAKKYTPQEIINPAFHYFDNTDFTKWLERIGIPTFIGSSKRVYPTKGIKPIEVLNAIISEIEKRGVIIKYDHEWIGWTDENDLIFSNEQIVTSDFTIFALGGGSWKVTGSNGIWLDPFQKKNIKTIPFTASNCAYKIAWSTEFINKHGGQPLKNIAIRCQDKIQKGEGVITDFGLEGNAIYALSPQIREELKSQLEATIYIDLKPTLSQEKINNIFLNTINKKVSDVLRKKLKLNATQVDLIKNHTSKETFINPSLLAKAIKNLEIKIIGTATTDEAISTVGGISLEEIDQHFQLKKLPHQYCIGEMLDYDAPTGGYLLQSCFSMGAYLAAHLNKTY